MSASKGAVFKIGRVETVAAKSGRIGMKFAEQVSVYAYEQGAPDIETKSTRVKKDEQGNVVYQDGGPPPRATGWYRGPYRNPVYEEYTYFRKDYTKVGSRWKWKKEQAAWTSVLVLRKHDWSGLGKLHELMNLDYDEPSPDMG